MSRRRKAGLRVLKAASSPIRMQILNILVDKGPQSYTELIKILRLNPSRDAGRFAYHLKCLLKADLIEPNVETKEYSITDLGRTVIGFTEDIQQRFLKRRRILVRTSRLAIEEFDRNKIVESLTKEASVPIDLAQKIARETEKRLSEFKTKYLTAPLIREIVNAILVEKGLEEYRHKLTRLGLPVFDVTQLMGSTGTPYPSVEALHKAAGDAVVEEYTLLNVLPRDIADAHLSGALHLNNLGTWVLRPKEFMHDLRIFLQQGLSLGRMNSREPSYPPPKSLEAALLTASNVLKIASTEISGEQALDFFNIFLAPFSQGLPEERIREVLRLFVFDLNQSFSIEGFPVGACLGLELLVPDFLAEKEAIGPDRRKMGYYADFVEECRRLASLLLEVMLEDDKPIFNPSLIMKIRPEVLTNKECEGLLFKSHRLAAETGLPYFANLSPKENTNASYTATGCRFATDWKGDWELDTLQTGNIDNVIINLPRVAYEAEGRETSFFELLDGQLEMALRALEIKYRSINQRARENLLPFLTQKAKTSRDQYFRIGNASRLVSFVGLNETMESFFDKGLQQDGETLGFAEKIMKYLSQNVKRYAKKPETRASLATVPNAGAARRLAQLDAEKYGWAKVRARGTREQPFYTDMVALPLEADVPWRERLGVEERFHKLAPGSHLAIIQLADSEQDPNELLSTTREIVRTFAVGLYTFNRHLTYCTSCQKISYGILGRCPSCGSVNMLDRFSRVSAKHLPLSLWFPARLSALSNRVTYKLASG